MHPHFLFCSWTLLRSGNHSKDSRIGQFSVSTSRRKYPRIKNGGIAVLNGLDDLLVKSLVVELEILAAEVQYTLTVIDIEDEDAFAFLKRLTEILYRHRNWTPDYDDVKQLSGFMWFVYTGWSVIDGYTEKDIIADMISAI